RDPHRRPVRRRCRQCDPARRHALRTRPGRRRVADDPRPRTFRIPTRQPRPEHTMTDLFLSAEDLTPERLSAVLGGTVRTVDVERIGTGQIALCYRLVLTGDDVPSSLVAKLPSPDPATRRMLAGAYRGEARFYSDIEPSVAVRTPTCYHVASGEDGEFTLLLEDAAPALPGDQLAGCTVDEAHDAVRNLAGLHGPRWCAPDLHESDWLTTTDAEQARILAELYGPAIETFLDGLGDLIGADDRDTLRACAELTEEW